MRFGEYLEYNLFDKLIDRNISFALYRLPKQNNINLVLQHSSKTMYLNNLEELNQQKGFVIAPFQHSSLHPIVLIKADIKLHDEKQILDEVSRLLTNSDVKSEDQQQIDSSKASTFEHYKDVYAKFQNKLNEGDMQKLVLSRTYEVCKKDPFSAGDTFKKACKKYPDNFIFLCNNEVSGTWFGCSPEILIAGKKQIWKTDALAGTQNQTEDESQISWDKKNIEEQQIVVDYMQQQLAKAQIKPTISTAKTIKSGNVFHIKSELEFEVHDTTQIGNILSLLHPSPAVCGFPKEKAFEFIIQNEDYDRKYYSGFLGYLDADENTDLFVNLRCMQIFKDKLRLFAGGGILPSSDLESEWKETEHKLQTILSVIN